MQSLHTNETCTVMKEMEDLESDWLKTKTMAYTYSRTDQHHRRHIHGRFLMIKKPQANTDKRKPFSFFVVPRAVCGNQSST